MHKRQFILPLYPKRSPDRSEGGNAAQTILIHTFHLRETICMQIISGFKRNFVTEQCCLFVSVTCLSNW